MKVEGVRLHLTKLKVKQLTMRSKTMQSIYPCYLWP